MLAHRGVSSLSSSFRNKNLNEICPNFRINLAPHSPFSGCLRLKSESREKYIKIELNNFKIHDEINSKLLKIFFNKAWTRDSGIKTGFASFRKVVLRIFSKSCMKRLVRLVTPCPFPYWVLSYIELSSKNFDEIIKSLNIIFKIYKIPISFFINLCL